MGNKKKFSKKRSTKRSNRRSGSKKNGGLGGNNIGLPKSTEMLSKPQATVIHGPPFLPNFMCELTYSNTEILTGTNGATATRTQYRLNSVYDPYLVGIGTQPYQFDQIANMYGAYIVSKAKVKVTFIDPSHDGCIVGYRIRSSQNTQDTSAQNVRWLATNPNTRMQALNNSGDQVIAWGGMVDIAKAIGITKAQYNDVDYAAAINTSPSVGAIIEPFIIDMGGNIDRTVKMTITICYHVRFFDYIAPNES